MVVRNESSFPRRRDELDQKAGYDVGGACRDLGRRHAVKVDTEHGKVTIHGTVESEAVKEKAEATVRGVGGVTGVKNLLQVVKQSRQESVKAADKDVKDAVENTLKADERLEGIKVKSVDNGLVILEGSTASLANELRAIEAAYAVAGVRQVDSGIATKEK
jgi:hyperosmotically inducible protein